MPSRSTSQSLNALPPGTVLRDYVIESELGSGGFSIVYLARHHLNPDWLYAIKEFLPGELAVRARDGATVHPVNTEAEEAFDDGLRRFRDEAGQLRKFRNEPAIVSCVNYFEGNGTAYLVMDHDDGLPLSELLRRREAEGQPFTEQDLLAVVEPLLEGLTAVHRAGVLHRDIKPGNIFVRRQDDITGRPAHPVLIDFGAAKQNYLARHSRSRAPYTPGYAAYEQVSSMGEIGPWTDVYALGALMWRVVAGGCPDDARLQAPDASSNSQPETLVWTPAPREVEKRAYAMNRGLADPMPSAAALGAGRFAHRLLEAIDGCLALYPEGRVRSCDELRASLRTPAASGGRTPKSRRARSRAARGIPANGAQGKDRGEADAPAGSARSSWRPARRFVAALAGAAAVAAIVAAGVAWFGPRSGVTPGMLEPIPHGTLTLELNPADAEVALPGVGQPYRRNMRLPEGEHEIIVRREGYADSARLVRVEGDTVASFALRSVEHCQSWNTEAFFANVTPQEVEDCLQGGADVNATDDNGGTPLHWAAGFIEGHEFAENHEFAIALLDAGANVNATDDDGWTPLHVAAYNENPDVAIALLDAGADVNATDDDGLTPLHRAAQYNENPDVAIALLDAGADVDETDDDGWTPLHRAAQYNENPDVAIALLDAGADVDETDDDGWTPLHAAADVTENPEVAITLLDAGANVNATGKNGLTPLHRAAWNDENPDVAIALLDAGANVNATDDDGWTPLHHAALFTENSEVAIALLDAGANVNATTNSGWTPLHYAAAVNENPEVAIALLDAGANVNETDDDGWTPLHRAAEINENPDVAIALLDAGANLDAGADVNATGDNGSTPLHAAAAFNENPEVAIALLDAGANVNATTNSGWTPLHYAAENNENPEVAIALLDAGADVNATDDGGLTPLRWAAVFNENPEVAEAIRAAGGR